MTFVISRADRKTAFWSQRTPANVGPGSYSSSPEPTARYTSAPFSIGSERPISTFMSGEVKESSPGPGAYDMLPKKRRERESRFGSSAFANRVNRPGPLKAGISPNPSFLSSPGPGAYDLSAIGINPTNPQRRRRQKPAILEPKPGAPSIPALTRRLKAEEGTGPGWYDPTDEDIGTSGKGTDFAASRVERKLWEATTSRLNPGPGQYTPANGFPSADRKHPPPSVPLKSAHLSQLSEDRYSPGPGSYTPQLPASSVSFSQVSSFLSKSARSQLWKSDFSVPGVGTYDLQKQSSDLDPKLVYYEDHLKAPKPAFLSSRKRDCLKTIEEDPGPGPGSYDSRSAQEVPNFSAHVEAGTVKFMTTQQRFKGLFEPKEGPAPGQYSGLPPKSVPVPKSSRSPSTRFQLYVRDNPQVILSNSQLTPPVGQYSQRCPSLSDLWKSSETRFRAHAKTVQNASLSFDSSAVRFDPKDTFPGERTKNTPGPGYYKRPGSLTGRRPGIGQAKRFDGFGDYSKDGRESVGPGRYHKDQSLLRKSFNMTVPRKIGM